MPESLFAPRSFRRSYLFACFAGALVLEGSLIGIAQIYAGYKSWDIPVPITELDTGPVLGEPVQELILPNEVPEPTPEQPTPPPEETPPPEDTPPPDETPEMTLDTPKPTASPKPFKLAGGTPPPANAKHGPNPQNGVVGGVPHAEKTTGTPGSQSTRTDPRLHSQAAVSVGRARLMKLSGNGRVNHVTFDASGPRIERHDDHLHRRGHRWTSNTVGFAKATGAAQPNGSANVPITYTKP